MTANEHAKAGRYNIGELDLDTAWPSLAGDLARGVAEEAVIYSAGTPAPQPETPYGSGQTQAEENLYRHLERTRESRPSGFPPMDALSARLNEFSSASQQEHVSGDAGIPASAPASRSAFQPAYPGGVMHLNWFEAKFDEVKDIVTRRQSGDREIIHINARLAEIISRVDRLAEALPDSKSISAVESRLSALVANLDTATKQSAVQSDRISSAAKQVREAADEVHLARQGVEAATKITISELGQTVGTVATITAQQIAEALKNVAPHRNLSRVEEELRALTELSRNNGERTAAALDRVHLTLREYLERPTGQQTPNSAHERHADQRKRLAVHMPIGADAPAFTRGTKDFGANGAKDMHLGSITGRGQHRPVSRLERELEAAQKDFASGKPTPQSAGFDTRIDKRAAAAPQTIRNTESAWRGSQPRGFSDRGFPILGVVGVAVLLLLASLALYYLHMTSRTNMQRVSAAPSTISANVSAAPARKSGTVRRFETSATDAPKRNAVELPSIFSATGAAGSVPVSGPNPVAGDIAALVTAASRGDREAQYRVGTHFLNNTSVQGNDVSAARWFARAAEQGHPEAQFLLASLFERGVGLAKDGVQAIEWYRRAASNGHVRAMHNLGVLLIAGSSQAMYGEAARWFELAASAGLTHSQYNLAILHERGLGMAKDDRMALFWYSVASQAGDQNAKFEATRLQRSLPPAVSAQISAEAARWRPSSNTAQSGSKNSARG